VPEEQTPNADEALALSLKEALRRLTAAGDPSGTLHELRSRLPELGPRALRAAALLAGVVHVRAPLDRQRDVLEDLFRWLQQPADELQARGDLAEAQAVLSAMCASLRDAGRADATFLPVYAELSRLVARLAYAAGDLAGAQALLDEALQAYRETGREARVVAVHVELGMLRWQAGDAAGLTEHLDYAADLFAASAAASAEPGLPRTLAERLPAAAQWLYYDAQQPELAVRLARHAARLAPGEPGGWLLLGNALARLQKFEGAAEAYARVAGLAPQDAASRANLAVALVNVGRRAEALRALDESLALAPREVRPLVLRGQLRAQAGDEQGAAGDLAAVLDLLEADRPADDHTPEGTRRYREHWTMWLAAYHNLIRVHRARRDRAALEAVAARLVATGDDALGAMGHRLRGDLAREDGRLPEARAAYDAALATFDRDDQALLARAQVAAAMGDLDGAIRDLAALAPRDRAPRLAIEGLEALRPRSERPEILRWLGFARFEIADFEGSDTHLDAYLKQMPGDVEARRWLGLSLISVDPNAKDGRPGDMRRLFRGLEELALCATAGDAEARAAFLWLLDRVLVGDRFLWPIGGSKPIAEALPDVPRALDQLARAQGLVHPGRDWAAGIAALSECIATAERAGLFCFAAYQHAALADWELLRGDLEAAARSARRAMRLRALAFTARSARLREQFEGTRGIDPRAGDMGLEVEHLHVYGLLQQGLDDAALTLARVLSYAGDREGALEALGDVAAFIARVDQASATRAKAAAEILRDLGRTDDALAVLERAAARAEGDDARASILVGRATILASLGRVKEAAQALREAAPLLDEARRWIVSLNVASFAQASGLHADALELLATIDIDGVARSDEDRFGYHYLRAATLEGLGRGAEARDAALQAVKLLEELRGRLKDLDLRASWTGKQEAAYALAVRVAAAGGDAGLAFDLCERSRSRQLVDEIAIGRSALDEEGRALERRLLDAQEERDVLAAIAGQAGSRPRPDLVLRLRQLDPDLELVEIGDDGGDRVSAETLARARARVEGAVQRLRQDIGERRLASAERLFGTVADHRLVRDLLREHV
jgi:tetratricopeptide (TPR) repeat protein